MSAAAMGSRWGPLRDWRMVRARRKIMVTMMARAAHGRCAPKKTGVQARLRMKWARKVVTARVFFRRMRRPRPTPIMR